MKTLTALSSIMDPKYLKATYGFQVTLLHYLYSTNTSTFLESSRSHVQVFWYLACARCSSKLELLVRLTDHHAGKNSTSPVILIKWLERSCALDMGIYTLLFTSVQRCTKFNHLHYLEDAIYKLVHKLATHSQR